MVNLCRSNEEFWDKLLRDSSETDELFNGGYTEESGEGQTPLFDALSDLVAMFSGVRARKVRVAATVGSLCGLNPVVPHTLKAPSFTTLGA
jgi:hypothetical protein